MNKPDIKRKMKLVAKGVGAGGEFVSEKAKTVAGKTVEITKDNYQNLVNYMDQDGNGEIDSADIILLALKVPGVKIKRDDFLRKEFFKNHPKEIIDKAIETNPAKAGIPSKEIDKIADEVIKAERNAVSGISVALGMPGGAAMLATIPADIA